MSETPEAPRLAETFDEVEDALLSRWPETRLEPSLDRILAFTELLGDPQRAYPVIHLTGTNGKTSTSRMIDTLLRTLELRTGRFTSPHVERMTERISLDGEQLTDEQFVRAFNDVAPYIDLVDRDQPFPLSFFETVVAMAYARFAEAPVDVAVVEVGMGGTWDATNVADGAVAVVLPIAVDHARYLGNSPAEIAVEKAGIIKPGAVAVLAEFAQVSSPGRLEIVRTGPTILLDAAHNPHGAEAVAAALEDSFTLDPLIGVIGVMGDKDAEGLLAAFEPHLAHVVVTQNSTDRAMPAAELAGV